MNLRDVGSETSVNDSVQTNKMINKRNQRFWITKSATVTYVLGRLSLYVIMCILRFLGTVNVEYKYIVYKFLPSGEGIFNSYAI
jgi:hypothetical protein